MGSIEYLMQNEIFRAALAKTENMEQILALFARAGVTVTEEDLLSYLIPNKAELYEEDLENVAGGYVNIKGAADWLKKKLLGKSSRGSSGSHRF